MLTLRGRKALVTGASRGIGRAVAEALVAAGADVAGVSRNWAAGPSRDIRPLTCDLGQTAGLADLVEAATGALGAIDILVNAAGTITRTEIPNVPEQVWDEVFSVNVRAPFFLTQLVAARMLSAGGGVILNISSLSAETVTGAPAVYSMSKAALLQMTRVMAARWAPSIRVNSVAPGYVETDLNRAWLAEPANRNFVLGRTPMGRLGTAADVASAAVFLCSPGAGFITGQNLRIDGGWSVH